MLGSSLEDVVASTGADLIIPAYLQNNAG